jgi:flagellar hook protein FlgE
MSVSATALVALSQAALSQAIERVDQAAEGIRNATQPSAGDADQLDLSTEAVRLLVAKNGYDAAIELARTADEISQRAIDLLA